MKISNFNKGIISSSTGSFWWGFLGTYYFQYITFIGTLEVVVHRSLWTCVILFFTTTFFNKWTLFKKIFFNKDKIFYLFITSILIFSNWTLWIYAVSSNKIIGFFFNSLIKKLQCAKIINKITAFCWPVENWLILILDRKSVV